MTGEKIIASDDDGEDAPRRSIRRFGLSITASISVALLLLYLFISAGMVWGMMPAIGLGGIYAEGDAFTGNVGQMYPVYQTGGSGDPADPLTDTPGTQCDTRPMVAFSLEDAQVEGAMFRKDLELPFMTNRFMSLVVTQPEGAGDPAFFSAEQVDLFITQMRAGQLVFRNIEMREGGPDGTSTDKWGPESGELYIEGGDTGGTQLPPDTQFPGTMDGLIADDIEMWLHGMQGQEISFDPGDQAIAVDFALEFPTDGELDEWYDGRLGFDMPEYPDHENPLHPAQSTQRDEYFQCSPTDT